MTPGSRVELERIDTRHNMRRFYSLAVTEERQLALFDDVEAALLLVVAWGRLGKRLRTLVLRYTAPEQLAARWRAILATRRQHHYVITREEWGDGSWRRRSAP